MIFLTRGIVNPQAQESIVYHGAVDVFNAWCDYFQQYNDSLGNDNEPYCHDWELNNIFIILIHRETREICAVRDYGRYLPEPWEYLFDTPYLPLYSYQPVLSVEQLVKDAEYTLALFNTHMENMLSIEGKPLFILQHLGGNSYVTWSVSESIYVKIRGYKYHNDTFHYSKDEGVTYELNRDYQVLPPTDELIEKLGLELRSSRWMYKSEHDGWYARPIKEPVVSATTSNHKDTYMTALKLINLSRIKDYGCDRDFSLLEQAIFRYEYICEIGGPSVIMEDIAKRVEELCVSILLACPELKL